MIRRTFATAYSLAVVIGSLSIPTLQAQENAPAPPADHLRQRLQKLEEALHFGQDVVGGAVQDAEHGAEMLACQAPTDSVQ